MIWDHSQIAPTQTKLLVNENHTPEKK